jgi:hypothetical protein
MRAEKVPRQAAALLEVVWAELRVKTWSCSVKDYSRCINIMTNDETGNGALVICH